MEQPVQEAGQETAVTEPVSQEVNVQTPEPSGGVEPASPNVADGFARLEEAEQRLLARRQEIKALEKEYESRYGRYKALDELREKDPKTAVRQTLESLGITPGDAADILMGIEPEPKEAPALTHESVQDLIKQSVSSALEEYKQQQESQYQEYAKSQQEQEYLQQLDKDLMSSLSSDPELYTASLIMENEYERNIFRDAILDAMTKDWQKEKEIASIYGREPKEPNPVDYIRKSIADLDKNFFESLKKAKKHPKYGKYINIPEEGEEQGQPYQDAGPRNALDELIQRRKRSPTITNQDSAEPPKRALSELPRHERRQMIVEALQRGGELKLG